MISSLITLLSALSLASVAGWFSISGFVTIYAGATFAALIMGVVAECAKVVTISWLYRNWNFSSWLIKIPLVFFTAILMAITSMGVFGFLSKAHLDKGSNTINNSEKIQQIDFRIAREKQILTDLSRTTAQLDSTVESYVEKDRLDKSLAVRKSQQVTRNQLKKEIDAANARIDALNEERFKYTSELRNLELEIGPIKYIAEVIYGENASKDITKSAVQLFTLLIVITLDPLASVLLIAANQSMVRYASQRVVKAAAESTLPVTPEPDNLLHETSQPSEPSDVTPNQSPEIVPDEMESLQENTIKDTETTEEINENVVEEIADVTTEDPVEELVEEITDVTTEEPVEDLVEETSTDSEVNTTIADNNQSPWAKQEEVLREIVGNSAPAINIAPSTKKIPVIKSWLNNYPGETHGRK